MHFASCGLRRFRILGSASRRAQAQSTQGRRWHAADLSRGPERAQSAGRPSTSSVNGRGDGHHGSGNVRGADREVRCRQLGGGRGGGSQAKRGVPRHSQPYAQHDPARLPATPPTLLLDTALALSYAGATAQRARWRRMHHPSRTCTSPCRVPRLTTSRSSAHLKRNCRTNLRQSFAFAALAGAW